MWGGVARGTSEVGLQRAEALGEGGLAQQAGHYLVQGRVGDVVEAEVVATKSLQAQASVIC